MELEVGPRGGPHVAALFQRFPHVLITPLDRAQAPREVRAKGRKLVWCQAGITSTGPKCLVTWRSSMPATLAAGGAALIELELEADEYAGLRQCWV